MTKKIEDYLRERERHSFVGRRKELSFLLNTINSDLPLITFVYGIGGIGKTSLARVFKEEATKEGHAVIALDCQRMPPSEKGILDELSDVTGQSFQRIQDVSQYLEGISRKTVLVFDSYEYFSTLEYWLRKTFIPQLPDNTRVVFFGRNAPFDSWRMDSSWQGLLRILKLEALDESEAAKLLMRMGVDEKKIEEILSLAEGYPLALKMAGSFILSNPENNLDEIKRQHVIQDLVKVHLQDIEDSELRRAVEASSVVRRITRPLLAAMLPDLEVENVYDRLALLPFIEIGEDGLYFNEVVRQAFETTIHLFDPQKYASYRRAAWKYLYQEMRITGNLYHWQYIFDLAFLFSPPNVKRAYNQTWSRYRIESAELDDIDAIREITLINDGPESLTFIDLWWEHSPEAFRVVRDEEGNVVGYHLYFDPSEVSPQLLEKDPQTKIWLENLKENPVPDEQKVLFCRRALVKDKEKQFSDVIFSFWIGILQYFFTHPNMRREYSITHDMDSYFEQLKKHGYQCIPDLDNRFDGKVFRTMFIDMGPNQLLGWLSSIINGSEKVHEIKDQREVSWKFDHDQRVILVKGVEHSLTPLEYDVMKYLFDRKRKVVSREELLQNIWGYETDVGSNVVDVKVRSIRKKLGTYASAIETVTGVGYRLMV